MSLDTPQFVFNQKINTNQISEKEFMELTELACKVEKFFSNER